jgi:phage anti-repressor protein
MRSDARVLWERLGSKQDYSTWIKARLKYCQFTQGYDFVHIPQICGTSTGATRRDDYWLTLRCRVACCHEEDPCDSHFRIKTAPRSKG